MFSFPCYLLCSLTEHGHRHQRSSRALGSPSSPASHRAASSFTQEQLLSQTQLLGTSVLGLKKEQQLEKENYKKIQLKGGKQSFLWLEISGGLATQGWQTHFKKYSIKQNEEEQKLHIASFFKGQMGCCCVCKEHSKT